MSTKAEPVRIDGTITHRTPRAILINIDGKDHWIPRSQCSEEVDDEDGTEYLMVSEWFAIKEGLI